MGSLEIAADVVQDRLAAVDDHDRTDGERGVVAGQPHGRAGHLLRLRLAADRLHGRFCLAVRMRSSRVFRAHARAASAQIGIDVPGADAVDADVLARVIDRELLGQHDDAALAGRVGRDARRGDEAVDRRDVDERAAALLAQMRDGELAAVERAAQVDGDGAVEILDA